MRALERIASAFTTAVPQSNEGMPSYSGYVKDGSKGKGYATIEVDKDTAEKIGLPKKRRIVIALRSEIENSFGTGKELDKDDLVTFQVSGPDEYGRFLAVNLGRTK